jgi:hypothetical protein
MVLLQVALVSIPTHNFARPPCWLKVHTKFHPNPSSGSQVESCRQTDGRTVRYDRPVLYEFISCTSCKECILILNPDVITLNNFRLGQQALGYT